MFSIDHEKKLQPEPMLKCTILRRNCEYAWQIYGMFRISFSFGF
jgi:hypothetical protein